MTRDLFVVMYKLLTEVVASNEAYEETDFAIRGRGGVISGIRDVKAMKLFVLCCSVC